MHCQHIDSSVQVSCRGGWSQFPRTILCQLQFLLTQRIDLDFSVTELVPG